MWDWGVVIPIGIGVVNLGMLLLTKLNDLKHLQKSVDRIEARLDEHVAYHMEKGL